WSRPTWSCHGRRGRRWRCCGSPAGEESSGGGVAGKKHALDAIDSVGLERAGETALGLEIAVLAPAVEELRENRQCRGSLAIAIEECHAAAVARRFGQCTQPPRQARGRRQLSRDRDRAGAACERFAREPFVAAASFEDVF